MTEQNFATKISLSAKQRHLRSLSEIDFRDKVLRPLFLFKGLKDGRDYCGPTEEGKDCVFVYVDPLGDLNLYAVQTKKGDINMSSNATKNVTTAITQVRTMLETDIPLLKQGHKRKPTKVFLCASGKINDRARRHVLDEVKSPHIEFRDLDDLIPDIDGMMPEFWLGVAANKSPYLNALHRSLTVHANGAEGADVFWVPVDEDNLVQLRLNRVTLKQVTRKGKYHAETVTRPEFEEHQVEDVLSIDVKHVLIVGGAGDGKTTALRRLAAAVAEASIADIENAKLPILVRAIELVGMTDDLIQFLSAHTSRVSTTSQAAFNMDDLENGRVVLLVDGLDEVSAHASRQAVVAALAAFVLKYPNTRVVLSSRNYLWLEELDGLHTFERFRISPIHWREAVKLVRRLQKGHGLPEEQAGEVLRRLQEVHGMELNPLLVTVFLASSSSDRTDLPANITELFKKFTEQMLGRWDEKKGFAQQYQAPLKDFLLKHVAVHMHREGLTSIPRAGLEDVLRRELDQRGQSADTARLVDEIVYRSGLFRVLGSQVEFKHLLLQEFFAGRGLSADEVEVFINDPWWQRCIVFYFGENPGQQTTLERVAKRLEILAGTDQLQAACTLGLALQACYLLTMDMKAILYTDVLEGLGSATAEVHGPRSGSGALRISDFIGEYITVRDSAACDVLRHQNQQVAGMLRAIAHAGADDYVEFWHISGLVECGLLEEALERIRAHDPDDRRQLLAIYLGALLYENTRVANRQQRSLAREIRDFLAPKVAPLRDVLLAEFKSELLELRRGKLEALPDPREAGSP